MSRSTSLVLLGVLAAALLTGARTASAQGASSEIRIRAPLDDSTCDETPRTITVLGLPIDVTNARFDVAGAEASGGEAPDESIEPETPGDDDGGANQGDGGGGDDGGDGDADTAVASGGCGDLVTGRTVDVTLSGDRTPLVADAIRQGDEDGETAITAPVQAVDTSSDTITVLGLSIGVPSEALEGPPAGEEEESASEETQPAERLVGHTVEVKLDADALPSLEAREIGMLGFQSLMGEGPGGAIEENEEVSLVEGVNDFWWFNAPLFPVRISNGFRDHRHGMIRRGGLRFHKVHPGRVIVTRPGPFRRSVPGRPGSAPGPGTFPVSRPGGSMGPPSR